MYEMTPFFNGEVEVWFGYLNDEVVRARHQGLDLVILSLYEYGIHTNALTIFIGQTALSADPDQTVCFLRARRRVRF